MPVDLASVLSSQQEATISWLHQVTERALPEIVSVSKGFSEDDDLGSTLEFLFRLQCDRATGVMALLGMGLAWDAEIVLRSYYECCVRSLFISLSAAEIQDQLIEEFWNVLGAASDQRRARKAHFAKKIFTAQDVASRDIFNLMQLDSMKRPKGSINKKQRQVIQKKWSFDGMIDELDRLPTSEEQADQFKSLLHIYGMASHLAHSDSGAIDLMLDRALRTRDEATLVKMTQCSRIMSDLVNLGTFSMHSIFKCLKINLEIATDLGRDAMQISDIGSPIRAAFHESQSEFYDSWLRPKKNDRP